jgi:hypothetical protein
MLKEVVMDCDHVAHACAPRESRECTTKCEVERGSVPLGTPNRTGLSLPLAAVLQDPNQPDRHIPPRQAAVQQGRFVREPAACCDDGCSCLRCLIPRLVLKSGDCTVESRSTPLKGNSALQRDDAPVDAS